MRAKPRMRQLRVTEKQPAGTIAQTVWVYPQAWAALAERFPQNLQTTICALLASVADSSTILIEGEYAREFQQLAQQHGIAVSRGRDFAGLIQSHVALLKEVDEMRTQQRVLEPFLKALAGGIGGGGQQAAVQQPAEPVMPPRRDSQHPAQPQQLPPMQFNALGEAADEHGNFVEDMNGSLAPLTESPAPSSMMQIGGGGQQRGVRPTGFPTPQSSGR